MDNITGRMDQRKKLKSWFLFMALVQFSMALAGEEINVFTQRRDQLRERINGKAVLYSGVEGQVVDKNFYYLTGIKEPPAFLLILPRAGDDFLFLPEVNDEDQLKTISQISGILQVLPWTELDYILTYLYPWQRDIYFPIPTQVNDYGYYLIQLILKKHPQLRLLNLSPILAEMRMVKSSEEVAIMKKSIEITAAGLWEAICHAKPGMYEYELQNIIEETFRSLGAERTSFASIIGSGPNSVIIHYDKNTRKTEPGEIVVMDVGAEFSEYAGDLTRTIPVSGKFTPRQREIYTIVLEAQQRAIEACRPGVTLADVDVVAREFIERMGYGKYFTHSTCHSLGLSVHDPWFNTAQLAPGMVITVEPGIYIDKEDLGVRIEDDVLITETGCLVLSSSLAKTPDDIEQLMEEKISGKADSQKLKLKEKKENRLSIF